MLLQKLYDLEDPIHFLFRSYSGPIHFPFIPIYLCISFSLSLMSVHVLFIPIHVLFIAYSFPFHVHSFLFISFDLRNIPKFQSKDIFSDQSII